MVESRLKTAVLGLDDTGQFLLKAASEIDYFEIAAVADRDTNLVDKIADRYQCPWYDDYRQLIIQNQLDCLFVAAGMHSCDEYVRMAMKKKFNVLKLAPAARNFEETAEFAVLAADEKIHFAVANPLRFAESYLAFNEYLQQGRVEQVFLITSFCNVGRLYQQDEKQKEHPDEHLWLTDPKLAGGGVLLRDCYQIIDQIILNFGLPQQVYCLNTNQAQDKQQRMYLVEDTVVIMMKFSDMLIGNFLASRREGIGPEEEFLRVYGKNKVLTVNGQKLAINEDKSTISEEKSSIKSKKSKTAKKKLKVSDDIEKTADELIFDDDKSARMKKVLNNFALSILSPDENKLCSSAQENLKNMAVIESAYLSARTAMPEEPGRILQMAVNR